MSDSDLSAAFRDIQASPHRAGLGIRMVLSALIYLLCCLLIAVLISAVMTQTLQGRGRLYAPDGLVTEIVEPVPILFGVFAAGALLVYLVGRWIMGAGLRGGWIAFPLIWAIPAAVALTLVGPYGVPLSLQHVQIFLLVAVGPSVVIGLMQYGLERRVQRR
ncbi:hypothetical protein V8J82_18530 [Gymnodinialimonas sp. 2305UL16-5]|uniref:hypothetical protein n=1 Tax=Gymnodinialimonas mytili TaxID=3126503 RepID=UPI0030B0F05F